MPVKQNIVAMTFDFDDTLTDDSITALLEARGIDIDKFWTQDVASLVRDGWDPPLAYMWRVLELTGPGKPLHGLTESDLRQFGKTLKPYPGLLKFFTDMEGFVRTKPAWRKAGITVEFYIISGGLEEIINEAPFRKFFKDAWGSSFYADAVTGQIQFPKNTVSFTEKTKFLFQVNKGIIGPESRENPDEVNKEMALEDRRIPFANMVYIGDGLTDIPCFSLVERGSRERKGGHTFGIVHPNKPDQERRKKIAWNLMEQRRTKGLYRPNYGKGTSLRYMIELAVEHICDDIVLREAIRST